MPPPCFCRWLGLQRPGLSFAPPRLLLIIVKTCLQEFRADLSLSEQLLQAGPAAEPTHTLLQQEQGSPPAFPSLNALPATSSHS
jgi:hypothetical protein